MKTDVLQGERIANSFAVDETGGVSIISDHAFYRFDAGVKLTWRQAYDRGSRRKPSRTAFGVLTGVGIQWNNHYAAITLGPDGSAYVATLFGLIRIYDTD